MKIDKEKFMSIRGFLINKLRDEFPREVGQSGSYPKIVLDIISSENPDLVQLLSIMVKWENVTNSSDYGESIRIKINNFLNLIKKNTLIQK